MRPGIATRSQYQTRDGHRQARVTPDLQHNPRRQPGIIMGQIHSAIWPRAYLFCQAKALEFRINSEYNASARPHVRENAYGR